MDPEANWQETTELAAALLAAIDKEETAPDSVDVLRLCELVLALDGWVKNGGFPPAVFQRKK